MKVTAVISEYNPFHNGHKYQIEKARELTGADYILVLMSGDFVQRGEPAFMDKRTRARAALLSGADLVLELPVYAASASAEGFADGAVNVLSRLGVIDYLSFGCECDDPDVLNPLAKLLADEPEEYRNCLRASLKKGCTFPAARAEALKAIGISSVEILDKPNNILAVEYLKALTRVKSSIQPVPVKREGAEYHSLSGVGSFCSATYLRTNYHTAGDFPQVKQYLPDETHELWADSAFPVLPDDFSLLLRARLMNLSRDELSTHLGVTDELAGRIIKNRSHCNTYHELATALKTKDITYSAVSRALTAILLSITKEDQEAYIKAPEYVRLLGFRKKGEELLKALSVSNRVRLIKSAKDLDHLSDISRALFEKEKNASDLYQLVLSQHFHKEHISEFSQSIVII